MNILDPASAACCNALTPSFVGYSASSKIKIIFNVVVRLITKCHDLIINIVKNTSNAPTKSNAIFSF